MGKMIEQVVKKLKTGAIKTVVPFDSLFGSDGNPVYPAAPYIVVKTEKGVGGRNFRIIVHFPLGARSQLENAMRATIKLLKGFGATSRNGAYNRLEGPIDYTDVDVVNDDKTISMEALYLMPTKTF
jgi:hypothetical protein